MNIYVLSYSNEANLKLPFTTDCPSSLTLLTVLISERYHEIQTENSHRKARIRKKPTANEVKCQIHKGHRGVEK